jgi:hypothetical protein
MNSYEVSVARNAEWFLAKEDGSGFIDLPADEYYGIRGDATLIGHSISARLYGWILTREDRFLESGVRSARWLAARQDKNGGWKHHAGYALDAAQCVQEGFYNYERLTGDLEFHQTYVRAVERMIRGTLDSSGRLLIGNLIECGEYAHFCFQAWKLTGEGRFRTAGESILAAITENFDETEGFWNTAAEIRLNPFMRALKPSLRPLLRACAARFNLKGKRVAWLSQHMFPLILKSRGPQYSLGLMAAESLLDTFDGSLDLPDLRRQTARAIPWVERNCAGPAPGSLVESKSVKKGQEVYPITVINDAANASLFPTSAYLLALVGMNDAQRYGVPARTAADWIVSMQDQDGGFFAHQRPDGSRFGDKFGNINFYASTALWIFNARNVRGNEPSRR